MQPATEEYVTDVPYSRGFASDLSPLMLRLVAAMNGFAHSRRDDFHYCELGSAHGDTTATLAAAYPGGRFLGVDLNPEHVASANRLARGGELDNLRFLERDFEDLGREDIPHLDFVTAHGVLSWIGPLKRKAVLDFAAAKLKPGGLLYVSYNALPGWAAVEPLRRLMLDRGAGVGGNSLERARAGLDFAKLLSASGAAYFADNPAAKDMVAKMEQGGLSYVVHEYLHAHWVLMYFADLAAEMAAKDLHFVGQFPLYLNYRDLAAPASMDGILRGVTDRIAFETLRDYATNTFFRRDVFIKGNAPPNEAAATAYIDAVPFGTLVGEGPLRRDVRLPHHTLHFAGEIFDALFPALFAGSTSVGDLARLPALAAFGQARLRNAVIRLALAGQVTATRHPTRTAPVPAGRFRVRSAYNRMILQERLSSSRPIVLASPVAGTGIVVSMLDAVVLRLLTEIPAAEWQTWVAEFSQRQPFRIRVGDRAVESDAERMVALLEQVESFRANRMPGLIELGIVEPEG
jgi:SAM-dependent methyltransferase